MSTTSRWCWQQDHRNMSNKNQRIISALVTAIFHALIVLILCLLTLTVAEKDEVEDGVPVMLGELEDAGGMDMGGFPTPDGAEPAEPVAPEASQSPDEPLVTQESEPSISVDESKAKAEKAKKAADEEARKKAEEAARKKAEEERKAAEEAARKKAEAEAAAKAAVNNKVAGAFGNSKNKGSSGNGTGDGAQGSPTGNANYGATSGVGGTGNNPIYSGPRKYKKLTKPSYDDNTSEGTVVVEIVVDAAGKVTSATIVLGKTNTTSPALRNAALNAARASTFNEGANLDKGTITYKFKQR